LVRSSFLQVCFVSCDFRCHLDVDASKYVVVHA